MKIYNECERSGWDLMNKISKFIEEKAKLEISTEFLESLIERSNAVNSLQNSVKLCKSVWKALDEEKDTDLMKQFIENSYLRYNVKILKTKMANMIKKLTFLLTDVYQISEAEIWSAKTVNDD